MSETVIVNTKYGPILGELADAWGETIPPATIMCGLCRSHPALVGCGVCGGYACGWCATYGPATRCAYCATEWGE